MSLAGPFSSLAPPLEVLPARGGPFTPKSIPGLEGWWDASQITGQADNSGLLLWPDESGVGNDLNSIPAGNGPPIYYDTTPAKLVNGLPAVWWPAGFDDAIQRTAIHNTPAPAPITVAVVHSGVTNQAVNPMLFSGTTAANPFVRLSNAAGSGYNLNSGFATGTVDNGTHCVIAVVNGAASSLKIDSAAPVAGNAGTFGYTTGNGFTAGAGGNGGGNWLNGALCEVILWFAALTPAQQNRLYTYEKKKWATA